MALLTDLINDHYTRLCYCTITVEYCLVLTEMEDLMTDIHFLMFKESEAKDGDIICNKCRHIFRKERDHKVLPCVKTSKSSSQTTATFSPPSVSLKIPATSKSHAYCCICKKPGPKLIVISPDVRTATYVDNNILIPSGNRCCPNHICDGHLNDDALCRIKTTDESFVNRTYLLEIMNKMRKKIRESASRGLNFDDSNLSEPDYITMTGLSKINFSEVCSTLSKYLKNTPARTITTTVAIFLCKLKSGMSNRFLSTIFCVSKSSVHAVLLIVFDKLLCQNLFQLTLDFSIYPVKRLFKKTYQTFSSVNVWRNSE
ncbi:unnamed protein product [Mytilus coruscus]|uniref:Uncharacterized protein n=1 Tax=Mytilus coruscus TaxID=42192 RepID=A0A6J8D7W6_MYTCO|nr:unnamed protein product [Mytilus coruscus]